MSSAPRPILEGRTWRGDLHEEVDVAIVGSGASGAVAARILAEAGHRVAVLEEGAYVSPDRYARFRPTQTLRHMLRDGGSTAAIGLGDTPLVSILAGRAVGGSSLLTGGVIFRIPEKVLATWVREHGLTNFSPEALESAYREVERVVSVETVPLDMRSRSTNLFGEGAQKLGYGLKPMRRNTRNCLGASRCNFGCPHGAKQSVDVTYLAHARRAGAQVISDCSVRRLLIDGDRVAGIAGRLLDAQGRAQGDVTVRAKRVLLAGSALSTPLLLQGAGVGRWSGQVGRNLTLHPAFRVAALFDEDVMGWKGALQSAYSDDFEDEGLTINSIFAPPNVVPAMMPGVGPEFMRYATQVRKLATFGAMVHDAGGGRVTRLPGGRPLFTYRMAKRDKARMCKGVKLLGETFFAAGAREVLLPIFGRAPLRSADELAFLDDPSIPARIFECMTFHPLGTARMGHDPARSVVKPTGETHDLRGLYVIDGSVFPSSIGVNSQLPIMTIATTLARGMRDAWASPERIGQVA